MLEILLVFLPLLLAYFVSVLQIACVFQSMIFLRVFENTTRLQLNNLCFSFYDCDIIEGGNSRRSRRKFLVMFIQRKT